MLVEGFNGGPCFLKIFDRTKRFQIELSLTDCVGNGRKGLWRLFERREALLTGSKRSLETSELFTCLASGALCQ